MNQNLTQHEANKTLRATPARHKAIRKLAADLDANIIEVTDEALAIGIRELKAKVAEQTASSN